MADPNLLTSNCHIPMHIFLHPRMLRNKSGLAYRYALQKTYVMIAKIATVVIPQIAQKRGAFIMFNVFKITAKSSTKKPLF